MQWVFKPFVCRVFQFLLHYYMFFNLIKTVSFYPKALRYYRFCSLSKSNYPSLIITDCMPKLSYHVICKPSVFWWHHGPFLPWMPMFYCVLLCLPHIFLHVNPWNPSSFCIIMLQKPVAKPKSLRLKNMPASSGSWSVLFHYFTVFSLPNAVVCI